MGKRLREPRSVTVTIRLTPTLNDFAEQEAIKQGRTKSGYFQYLVNAEYSLSEYRKRIKRESK